MLSFFQECPDQIHPVTNSQLGAAQFNHALIFCQHWASQGLVQRPLNRGRDVSCRFRDEPMTLFFSPPEWIFYLLSLHSFHILLSILLSDPVLCGAGGLPGVRHPCPFWRLQSPRFLHVRWLWVLLVYSKGRFRLNKRHEVIFVHKFANLHLPANACVSVSVRRYSEWPMGQVCDSSKPRPNMDSDPYQQVGS